MIEEQGRHFRGAQQVVQVVIGLGQLVDLLLVLGVDRAKLLVGRLELLPAGVQLLIGALKLLVGRLEFLVRGLQLFVAGLQLLDGRLEVLLGGLKLLLELADTGVFLLLGQGNRLGLSVAGLSLFELTFEDDHRQIVRDARLGDRSHHDVHIDVLVAHAQLDVLLGGPMSFMEGMFEQRVQLAMDLRAGQVQDIEGRPAAGLH